MFHATTILGYLGKRHNEACAVIGGDGQVSFGSSVLKGNAIKIRRLCNNKVLAGFAGSTADAFSLFDMFERVLDSKKGDLVKSAMEFSKEWRRDKYLRKLEAMMIVMDLKHVFILTGSGDVVEPEDGRIAAIGSGGNYALSAARALDKFTCMDPKELVTESLRIASGICVYTNACIKTVEITQEQRIDDAQQDA